MTSRRKPATYGKSVRKLASDLSFAAVDTVAEPSSIERPWAHGSKDIQGLQSPNSTTANYSHGRDEARGLDKERLHTSARGAGDAVYSAAIGEKASSPFTSDLRSASDQGVRTHIRHHNLYDIPSSDDGDSSSLKSRTGLLTKKRKLSETMEAHTPNALLDDDSLPQHVTTGPGELESDKRSELEPKAERAHFGMKPSNQATSPSRTKLRSQTPLTPNEQRTARTTQALKPRANSSKGGEASSLYILGRPLPITSESRANSAETRSISPSAAENSLTPPKTPPRISSQAKEVTTPRQRELWRMLLRDDNQYSSPSQLDLPSLHIDNLPEGDSIVSASAKTKKRPPRPARPNQRRGRIRLVDKLTHGDRSEKSSSKDFDDDHTNGYTHNKRSRSRSLNSGTIDESQSQVSSDLQSPSKLVCDQPSQTSQGAPPVAPLLAGPLKVTYAKQRSYLTDGELDETAMLGIPIKQDIPTGPAAHHESRQALTSRHKSTRAAFDMDEAQESSQNDKMRSIHELRESGGNVRLIGEMETILDDISEANVSSPSLRRARFCDLVNKLHDPTFCRVFLDQGMDNRLFAYLKVSGDLIADTLFSAVVIRLLSGVSSTHLVDQASHPRLLDFWARLLDHGDNLVLMAKSRSYNMSKVAQAELRATCDSLLDSNIWTSSRPLVITGRLLSLQCIEYVIRQIREAGRGDNCLTQQALSQIFKVLHIHTNSPQASPTLFGIDFQLALSILESYTISSPSISEETSWAEDMLQVAMDILPKLEDVPEEIAGPARILVLRLYLNLTNNNRKFCEAFSRPSNLSPMLAITVSHFELLSKTCSQENSAALLDKLILSLGTLINLAETSAAARKMSWIRPHGRESFLDILLALFLQNRQNAEQAYSEEETSFNVAIGYLSMLLSFLCIDHDVKAQVSSRLQGGNLRQLLDTVEEFLQYHRQIDSEIRQNGGEVDSRVTFISRLQGLVDGLKQE